jgi:hypothetical protein
MNLKLMPDGAPHQHLGISHTICHWLNPEEQWEDLAVSVSPNARPRAVWKERPGFIDVCGDRAPFGGGVASHWDALRWVYRGGYGPTVSALASAYPSPSQTSSAWIPAGNQLLPTMFDVDKGVILRVRKRKDEWTLYSSFRPSVVQFRAVHCPPSDPSSVLMRTKLYGLRVARIQRHWR